MTDEAPEENRARLDREYQDLIRRTDEDVEAMRPKDNRASGWLHRLFGIVVTTEKQRAREALALQQLAAQSETFAARSEAAGFTYQAGLHSGRADTLREWSYSVRWPNGQDEGSREAK